MSIRAPTGARAWTLAFAMALAPTVARAEAPASDPLSLSCREAAATTQATLRFGATFHAATVTVQGIPGALLEIEERDLEIALTHDDTTVALDSEAPPRFGRGFLATGADETTLHLARVLPSHARGAVIVRLHCAPDASTNALATWLQALGRATAPARAALPRDAADAMVAALATLATRAPDAWSAALAAHWRAQALLLSEQTAQAGEAFAAVATLWRSVPDDARAAAAEVAYVEDLQRLGRADEVLARAADVTVGAEDAYYPARLRHAGCVALRYAARYDAADRCFGESMKTFAAMDERAEMVSVVQDHAALKHLQGRDDEAEEMARAALELIDGPDAAMLRGRVQSLRADIALNRASLPEALALLHAAMSDFRAAGLSRWEGNMLLKVSALQRELGAMPEARAAAIQALERFPYADAPARVAAALVTLARIDEATGRDAHATFWLTLAERIYAQLGMVLERDGVQASLATLALAAGDVQRAQVLLDAADPSLTYYRDRWALARARAESLSGAHAAARATLASIPQDTQTLQLRIAFALASARASVQAGDSPAAAAELLRLRDMLDRMATAARNPLLRYLLARRLEQIHAQAAAVLLPGDVRAAATFDVVWPMLRRRSALLDLRTQGESAPSSVPATLDREIAADLLLGQARSASATSADVLGLLARDDRAAMPEAADVTPEQFVERLAPDVLVLSHAEVGDRGVLVWLGREVRRTTATPSNAQLRVRIAALRTALADPGTALHEIERRAAALGQLLFGDAPALTPPRRLRIDRDSILADIPWAVLHWPGQLAPLADTTLVTLAPLRETASAAPVAPDAIDIVVAGQPDAAAALPNALPEAGTVLAIARQRGVAAELLARPRREQVLASLAAPGRILHVAAHGFGDPGRIGYSGIWLAGAAQGSDAEFLGWTEPLMRGVHARLVVLNACSLARGHDAADASMSFAAALSRAGATDVVAALWSTSDAATTVWVPAFHEALWQHEAQDPALAVAAAVAALRGSRMFRHPFYWASLVHLQGGQ